MHLDRLAAQGPAAAGAAQLTNCCAIASFQLDRPWEFIRRAAWWQGECTGFVVAAAVAAGCVWPVAEVGEEVCEDGGWQFVSG